MSKTYDHIVYIYNSGATNQARARKLYASIKASLKNSKASELEVLKNGPEKSVRDIERIGKNFNSRTLAVLGGGDGSVNFVIETILSSEQLSAVNKKVCILPVWGGNANDLAVMLNGGSKKESEIVELIKNTKIKEVYPLKVTFLGPAKGVSFTRLAINYASFGITARAIAVIEKSSKNVSMKLFTNMPLRLIPETIDVFKAFIAAEPFVVEGKNKKETIYERVFINGSRIAKINRFPAKLTKKQYYEASSTKKTFGLDFARAIIRPHAKNIKNRPTSFSINDDTMCQIDGETIAIKAGTRVRVEISKQPFKAVWLDN